MVGYVKDVFALIGRILLAAVFIYDGFDLIHNGPDKGYAYVQTVGLPAWSWWLALALELGGGALIVLGLMTRWVSVVFVVFCLTTAILFHGFTVGAALDFSKAGTAIESGKDLGLAGAFLLLIAYGAGAISLDYRIRRKL